MSIRIIQWGTGNVGKHALRTIVERPGYELVGLRVYNPDKVGDPARVVTPPYDVISSVEQQTFYERHPHNVIRLILGKSGTRDSATDNPHTRAAAAFRANAVRTRASLVSTM